MSSRPSDVRRILRRDCANGTVVDPIDPNPGRDFG
jgi:hypothetical protein